MLRKQFGKFLMVVFLAGVVPVLGETVKGSAETPEGEFRWEIVLTPTGQADYYRCTIEVTETATNEVIFAPAVTFKAGSPVVADDRGGVYTSKVTISAEPGTGSALVDLEIRKGEVDLVATRTQVTLK